MNTFADPVRARASMTAGAVLATVLATVLAGAAAQADTVAIVNGQVHTLGPRGVIDNATVLIEDGRIRSVGADVDVPAGARVIDAADKVVTPGLFDPFSSLGLVEVSLAESTVDRGQSGERYTAAFDVAEAINPNSTLIPINRIEGVTRAFVAPGPGQDAVSVVNGLGALIHLGGEDFLVRERAGLVVTLGERGAQISGGSRISAALQLRELLEDAADYGDHRPAYERGSRRDYVASRLDLEAVSLLLNSSMPLVLRAHRASDLRAAAQLARDRDLSLILVGAAEAWMVADELADAGISVILDPMTNLPGHFESLGARADNAALLHAAGVQFAFATFDSHNARNVKQAAGNAVAAGLAHDAALAAITLVPAQMFGLARDHGRLAAGYVGDVVVWSGDPLEVTTFADHVFIDGREMPMISRQTLLRDRYMDLDGDLPHAYRPVP